jgi:hypothetical protein
MENYSQKTTIEVLVLWKIDENALNFHIEQMYHSALVVSTALKGTHICKFYLMFYVRALF